MTALAAGFLWVAWPAGEVPSPVPPHAPVAVAPQPAPAPAEVAPAPPPVAPPVPPRARKVVAAPLVPTPAPSDDAVAEADDWPAPPFEDLRAGTPKSPESPVRAVQLVVSGGAARRVGDTVALTVVSASEVSLAVCVTGPERGVVWRGAVPAGRTALSRAGHPQSFAFGAPGTYRFVVGTAAERSAPDLDRCTDPVHVVEVEVGG